MRMPGISVLSEALVQAMHAGCQRIAAGLGLPIRICSLEGEGAESWAQSNGPFGAVPVRPTVRN